MLPTAPIPVHTAYAVPNGSERNASAINVKLSTMATAVAAVGQNRVSPSEYFKPSAQPTSSRPAPSSASHPLMMSPPKTKSGDQCAQRDLARDERSEAGDRAMPLTSQDAPLLTAPRRRGIERNAPHRATARFRLRFRWNMPALALSLVEGVYFPPSDVRATGM